MPYGQKHRTINFFVIPACSQPESRTQPIPGFRLTTCRNDDGSSYANQRNFVFPIHEQNVHFCANKRQLKNEDLVD